MTPRLRARTIDLAFDNDDASLVISSGPVRSLGDDRRRWSRAVGRGYLLPLSLPTNIYTRAGRVRAPRSDAGGLHRGDGESSPGATR